MLGLGGVVPVLNVCNVNTAELITVLCHVLGEGGVIQGQELTE